VCSHLHQRVESSAPTVSVGSARTANKSSPDSFPSDDPPQSMKLFPPKTWPDKMNVFSYRYDDVGSVIIRHIFTCNLDKLQVRATELFKKIQMDVELEWQAASDIVASGMYHWTAICSPTFNHRIHRSILFLRFPGLETGPSMSYSSS
jgi:hypothetical protein